MKKLLLSLLCVGSILALPGCWCCRKTCEAPCQEDYCDDYDECDDYCDDKEAYEEGDVIETQQGVVTKVTHHRRGRRQEDMHRETGHEEQQGYRTKTYYNDDKEKAPRKIMMKPVHPQIMRDAEAAGKQCRILNPEHRKLNKSMRKDMMAESSSKRNGKMMMQEDNMQMMDQE
jgi:hypothetical protein